MGRKERRRRGRSGEKKKRREGETEHANQEPKQNGSARVKDPQKSNRQCRQPCLKKNKKSPARGKETMKDGIKQM